MEKNNFEKQVQEKMAELNIQPSEKAWAAIESRIGKKDSRRKILWFLLIGLFLLAGGGYLFLLDGKSNGKDVSQLSKQNTEKIIQKSVIDQQSSFETNSLNDQPDSTKSNLVFIPSPDKSSKVQSPAIKSNIQSKPNQEKNKANQKDNYDKDKDHSPDVNQVALIKSQEYPKELNSMNSQNETSKIKMVPGPDSIVKNPGAPIQKEKDFSTGNKISTAESITQKEEINPEKKKELIAKKNNDQNEISKVGENTSTSSSSHKSWKMGMTFSAAQAYIGDGIQLGFNKDKSYTASDPNYSYNTSASRPVPSLGQASIGPASSPKNSIGFNAGIILNKEISPKTSFATGLGYTYYTNSILVGNQLTLDNYSSAGMLSSYRNNFHFADLPLSVQFNLNKNHKIPLNLSAGFTLSRLIASDAVQYKSGFYEEDNSLFNKTQFRFSTGISATFFKKISVGPFYNYGMNSLAKEGMYGKKHLNSLGIKADFIFQKK